MNIPWVVIGDFNSYLSCEDKKGGGQPNFQSMRGFENCINSSSLIASEMVGDYFTWARDFLKERIDWAFYNQAWSNTFPFSKVYHLSRFGSDNRPILLRTIPRNPNTRVNPPFPYQAAWFLENDFIDIVKRCWQVGVWNEKVNLFTREAARWSQRDMCNLATKRNALLRRIEGVE